MNALPGPSDMPDDWFMRLLRTPRIVPPGRVPTDFEAMARWEAQLRGYVLRLWAEAWAAGAAWQQAHAPKPLQMGLSGIDEKLIEQFRKQLGGLPDGPSEG